MASKIDLDSTAQELTGGQKQAAVDALAFYNPEAVKKRAGDRVTKNLGERIGTAMGQTGRMNTLAATQEGAEAVDRAAVEMGEDLYADSFTNTFSMFDKLKGLESEGRNMYADAVAAIKNESNELGGVTGYMTDNDEEKLKQFVANEIAGLTPEEQWKIWNQFKDEMFDVRPMGIPGESEATVAKHFTQYTGNPVPTKKA